MIKSDSISKIAPALLEAQAAMGAAKKDSENPFFKSKYADLGAVMEVCKKELNDNGIVVLQPVGTDEGGVYVETILLHSSGEFISDKMRLAVKQANDPQAQGSAISYARRYSLQSMVFIPAEDDDAEKATRPVVSTPVSQETCQHTIAEVKTSNSEANKGRQYSACKTCGKFLKWIALEKDTSINF